MGFVEKYGLRVSRIPDPEPSSIKIYSINFKEVQTTDSWTGTGYWHLSKGFICEIKFQGIVNSHGKTF